MTRILCDHCLKLIKDPRKSFIFSAEKFGVVQTDSSIEKDELMDVSFYYNEQKTATSLHKTEKIFCSECMMDLWKQIQEFAENSVTKMEDEKDRNI